jgi:hypothetical protein
MKGIIESKDSKEFKFEALQEQVTFSYWDKESDVDGYVVLRPSLIRQHEKVVSDAGVLVEALTKQKKQGREEEKRAKLLDFAIKEKDKSEALIAKYTASISPFIAAVRPVIEYDSDGRSLSFTDIYEETKDIRDDAEALEWWRAKRLAEIMEAGLAEDFYSVSLAKMIMRMREAIESLSAWVNLVKLANPSLPDVPSIQFLADDKEAEILYERLVLSGIKELSEIPGRLQSALSAKLTDYAEKGYLTEDKKRQLNIKTTKTK